MVLFYKNRSKTLFYLIIMFKLLHKRCKPCVQTKHACVLCRLWLRHHGCKNASMWTFYSIKCKRYFWTFLRCKNVRNKNIFTFCKKSVHIFTNILRALRCQNAVLCQNTFWHHIWLRKMYAKRHFCSSNVTNPFSFKNLSFLKENKIY